MTLLVSGGIMGFPSVRTIVGLSFVTESLGQLLGYGDKGWRESIAHCQSEPGRGTSETDGKKRSAAGPADGGAEAANADGVFFIVKAIARFSRATN